MEERINNESTSPVIRERYYDSLFNHIPNGDFNTVYYGVYIPSDLQVLDGVSNVFTDKMEALKLVKKYKKARFKSFYYYHEAEEFALQGAEFPNNNITSTKYTNKKSQEQLPTVEKYQFRGPKSQDLVKLRKGIESGDFNYVETTVWENPRYLISSGDTPSILQEGFRYNALHVAAKAKNQHMCELILNTVGNLDFIKLLYGDDDHQENHAEERAKMLLDLYLNTPDKGLNETPLHFAVKYGAAKVVEVLVSFIQCDKMVRNKYGKLPSQIICDRCDGHNAEKVKNEIAMLLEENYYVPVLRSEDSCSSPVIGAPFSPSSPPNYNINPIQPRIEIHAYAGPMDKEGAQHFRKIWKTPPRITNFDSPYRRKPFASNNTIDSIAELKLKDPEKGLEIFGRDLAKKYAVGWKEYWPFLDSFIDLSSAEGIEQLEAYLASRNTNTSCNWNSSEHQNKKTTVFQASENSVKLNNESPITELCRALRSCTLSDNGINEPQPKANITDYFKDNTGIIEPLKPDLFPFSCVEKSCQVFAHRISTDIVHFIENEDSVIDILEAQMKFLEQLVASYIDDGRFFEVNFYSVHSRLSSLIFSKLKENGYDDMYLKKIIEKIQENSSKNLDCFSSDDECGNYRTSTVQKKVTSGNKQLVCVLGFLLNIISKNIDKTDVYNDEDQCKQIWLASEKCSCVWQSKNSRKNTVKRSSQRLKLSLRNSLGNVSRRLSFENDELDFHIVSNQTSNSDNASSDEEFYTPPSSPSFLKDSSDEEDFSESLLPECEVFIEGNVPSKMDNDVYTALKYAKVKLNPKDYPNVYKWHHTVSLYSENKRKSWSSPKMDKYMHSPKVTSTPCRSICGDECQSTLPHGSPQSVSKSWLRITGANSPKASLRNYRTKINLNL